jgi:hypothetical protein
MPIGSNSDRFQPVPLGYVFSPKISLFCCKFWFQVLLYLCSQFLLLVVLSALEARTGRGGQEGGNTEFWPANFLYIYCT